MPTRKATGRLSDTENDLRPSDGAPRRAAALLDELAADRTRLAQRLAAPAWLYPAFGALTALYVAAPALEPGAASDLVTTLAVAATLLLVWAYPRLSGVRVSRTGASARLTLGLLLGATLLLLSTSLGLVALGLRWWTPLPAVASFALTVQLGRAFDRRYREHVRRGA